jgi:alkylation response protein AidB-like acyl-CoA dehydrogenase
VERDADDFCRTLRHFAECRIRPAARQMDESNVFPRELHLEMAQAGLLDMSAGAAGQQRAELAMAGVVELSRASASVGNFAQNVIWAKEFLAKYGNERQLKLAARLGRGESICAIAITEPDAGSNAGGLAMSATPAGAGYRLDGVKTYVTFGSVCDQVLLFARTGGSGGKGGLTAFCVARDTPGVEIGPPDDLIGLRGLGTCTMTFKGCEVPGDSVVGRIDEGFEQMADCLVTGRLAVASMALGIAQEAIEVAVDHAGTREQFGRPIAKFQAIQFPLAELQARADGVRALLDQVARMNAGKGRVRLAAEVKLLASGLAMDAAIQSIQTFGGAGCLVGSPCERLMRDAKVTQIIEGTSEIQKLIIGRDLFAREQ